MNKKIKKLAAVVLTICMVLQIGAINVTADQNWDAYIQRYGDEIDVDSEIRAIEKDPVLKAQMDAQIMEAAKEIDFTASVTAAAANESYFTYNGGTKIFLGYDTIYGSYFKNFTLRSIGQNVEIWVANDLGFYGKEKYTDTNGKIKYRDIPDPFNRPAHIVTQEQVDKLRDEFDNNIFQKDTEFFGMPKQRVGANSTLPLPAGYYAPADGKERVIMLVDNCRDENFYNPSYPFYVAGFFSSSFTGYFDRNIINIDTNKWSVRIPNNSIYGTVAHEFQHLIHRDNDANEEKWVNEGMADFAQYLCGYGHDWGHVNFFLDHPENSLVSWDEHYSASTGPETLADYGQAYLMQLYLNDHFGRDFIQTLAKDKDQGIVSMNKILAQFNTGIDFNELFRRFTVALSVDSKNPGNGIYNFDSIDVKINYASADKFQKGGVPAWGADYLKLTESKTDFNNIKNIMFEGVQIFADANPWKIVDNPDQAGNKVLWGNKTDKDDNKTVIQADLTGVASATLKFQHKYDIEEKWDFGFVQVSTDGGKTWSSLGNANTRTDYDPGAKASITANLPGFTGTSNGWKEETFDLTPYAGKNIYIDFRYMTDDAYTEAGWFIDNIQIPEIGYTNDCSSMDTFINYDLLIGNLVDYMVTFVNEKVSNGNGQPKHYQVKTINPVNVTPEEQVELQKFLSSGNNYMIIWYAAPVGTTGPVDYSYEIITKDSKK